MVHVLNRQKATNGKTDRKTSKCKPYRYYMSPKEGVAWGFRKELHRRNDV